MTQRRAYWLRTSPVRRLDTRGLPAPEGRATGFRGMMVEVEFLRSRAVITLHHLGVSQSDRVVWLMEELGVPYRLRWYRRTETGLAPDAYLALHPAATAPVIEDDGKVLTESAVILEYICHRYAAGRLTVSPRQPNYTDYLYWMHF